MPRLNLTDLAIQRLKAEDGQVRHFDEQTPGFGILKVVQDTFQGPCNYILVHNIPEFGRVFHPPQLLDMLGAEWTRCGHPPFTL